MPPAGKLYTISAPSGAGKTSLVNALLESMPNLAVSISHTTRAMRPGEVNGVNYHFVEQPQFEQLITQNAFLEYARVFKNYYGTSRAAVEQLLQEGKDVILEIDWQGAQQVKHLMPGTRAIFILPPSRDTLEQRLTARGQDNSEIIAARMAEAVKELSHYVESDYLVVNSDFDQALEELRAIVLSHRLLTPCRQQAIEALLKELLG